MKRYDKKSEYLLVPQEGFEIRVSEYTSNEGDFVFHGETGSRQGKHTSTSLEGLKLSAFQGWLFDMFVIDRYPGVGIGRSSPSVSLNVGIGHTGAHLNRPTGLVGPTGHIGTGVPEILTQEQKKLFDNIFEAEDLPLLLGMDLSDAVRKHIEQRLKE